MVENDFISINIAVVTISDSRELIKSILVSSKKKCPEKNRDALDDAILNIEKTESSQLLG